MKRPFRMSRWIEKHQIELSFRELLVRASGPLALHPQAAELPNDRIDILLNETDIGRLQAV